MTIDASSVNGSTEKTRVTIRLTDEERQAFEEFREADARTDLANAVKASALLGLDRWRTEGRPKGLRLVPVITAAEGGTT